MLEESSAREPEIETVEFFPDQLHVFFLFFFLLLFLCFFQCCPFDVVLFWLRWISIPTVYAKLSWTIEESIT